jgi:hypothetical protein
MPTTGTAKKVLFEECGIFYSLSDGAEKASPAGEAMFFSMAVFGTTDQQLIRT